jgi:hypothetical protein
MKTGITETNVTSEFSKLKTGTLETGGFPNVIK